MIWSIKPDKEEDLNYHIGANIFVTVKEDSFCVGIGRYWKPENGENLVPTKKGICLRPLEYLNLKLHLSSIEKAVPELETIEPCFLQDNHQNQLGMLRCAMCNPLEYQNWWNDYKRNVWRHFQCLKKNQTVWIVYINHTFYNFLILTLFINSY